MPDPYTYLAKPVGTPYTNTNSEGRYQYDEAGITYDDSGVFYDGINETAYTNLAKPVGTPYTNIAKPTT